MITASGDHLQRVIIYKYPFLHYLIAHAPTKPPSHESITKVYALASVESPGNSLHGIIMIALFGKVTFQIKHL